MGVTSSAYRFILVLHILAAIVGFGAVFFNGLGLNGTGRAAGRVNTTFRPTPKPVEWVIYAVPILGIILVLLSNDAIKFSQGWISASFLFVIVWLGVEHGLHRPNLRQLEQLAAGGGRPAGGSRPAELERREKRAAAINVLLDVILIAIVFLMVFQPGRG